MSLFDRFKKKKEEPKKKSRGSTRDPDLTSGKDIEKKVPMQDRDPDSKDVGKKKLSKADLKRTVSAYNIIKEPCITEKASFLAEQNKYVFKVYLDANKIEIKKAIELIYNTKVKNVRIIHISPKKRRLGRHEGWRGGLKHGSKKAIVTLKKNEKIELLPR